MSEQKTIDPKALEPLYNTWEEPCRHRIKADKPGEPAKVVEGRRPSPIVIAQNLRGLVRDWREAFYAGGSDTTLRLLTYWFEESHPVASATGDGTPFRYHFAQREALETLVYLKEFRKFDRLSQVIEEFGGPGSDVAARGLAPGEDDWTRYAFKIAIGVGKTKVMSLAIVWSYFHAQFESESPLAKHFVMIAPNLTVYERLKEDFANGKIFDSDPLIPAEWRGDWNLSVVLQDETIRQRTSGGLSAQLDFSATPKGDKGQLFKHIVCDTPLGEAVDAGIVKTPIIGKSSQKLPNPATEDAAYRFDAHLRIGYERWRKSCEEWRGSEKKPLMFIMCENTEAADQIANRLNGSDDFPDLKGRTINLHTNLKGKIKKVGTGFNQVQYSIYARVCASEAAVQVHVRRVENLIPDDGEVRLLCITDKQFERQRIFQGKLRKQPQKAPRQLEFF